LSAPRKGSSTRFTSGKSANSSPTTMPETIPSPSPTPASYIVVPTSLASEPWRKPSSRSAAIRLGLLKK
jgi:hypothetical protein